MKKFEIRIKSVSRVLIEAETVEQAKSIAEKGCEIDFNTEVMEVLDSYDEFDVVEPREGTALAILLGKIRRNNHR